MDYFNVALKFSKNNKTVPDHLEEAGVMHYMASTYNDMGDNQQAKEYYRTCLNKLGPDHVDVVNTYYNIGSLHKDLGDHQQAN